MKKGATIRTETGSVALVVHSVRRDGHKLVIDGKALGTMSMSMVLNVEEFFNVLKIILSWVVISYILLLPYFALVRVFKRNGKPSP